MEKEHHVIQNEDLQQLPGTSLIGAGGEKLGTIDVLYADEQDGTPTFATVHTGMFGSKTSFVPLSDATTTADGVRVPYDKELVKAAPHVERDEHLSPEEEERLYRHYGLGETSSTTQGEGVASEGTTMNTGHDTSGPTTDEAMTRSEERLRVGTEKTEVGRARLRKYIVTENVTQTVPVSHEEVRIEREPITDGNVGPAMDGPAISEEEHEIVLTAERPVIAKETVPVERVRIGKETVTEQQTVNEQVRKEQIATDGVDDVYPAGTRNDADENVNR